MVGTTPRGNPFRGTVLFLQHFVAAIPRKRKNSTTSGHFKQILKDCCRSKFLTRFILSGGGSREERRISITHQSGSQRTATSNLHRDLQYTLGHSNPTVSSAASHNGANPSDIRVSTDRRYTILTGGASPRGQPWTTRSSII